MPRRSSRQARRWASALALALCAGTASGSAEDERRPGTLRGYLEARPIGYFQDGSPDAAIWGRARLDWEMRLSASWIARAGGRLDLDGHGDVDRSRPYDDGERRLERSLLNPEELSLEWSGRNVDLAVGKMIIPWGRADGFNPTDNLTPRDYLDPLEPERMAAWAARGRAYLGNVTLEPVILPFPATSRLPTAGDRWLPLPETVGSSRIDYIDDTRLYPDREIGNAAWALKLDHRAGSLEWSLSHYDGWEDQPSIRFASPAFLLPPPPVIPVALIRQVSPLEATGGDLAWVTGGFVLRAEAARHERGGALPARFDFYILEGEWIRGDWRFIASVAGIEGDTGLSTGTAQFEQEALPAAILHLERSVPTGPGFSLQALSNLNGDGFLARAGGSWPLAASLRLTAGLDLTGGEPGTFLGTWSRNDRAWAALRWSY